MPVVNPMITTIRLGVEMNCIQSSNIYSFWSGPATASFSVPSLGKYLIADSTDFPQLANYEGSTIYEHLRIVDPTGTSIFSFDNSFVSVDSTGIYIHNGGSTSLSMTAGNDVLSLNFVLIL